VRHQFEVLFDFAGNDLGKALFDFRVGELAFPEVSQDLLNALEPVFQDVQAGILQLLIHGCCLVRSHFPQLS